MNKNNCRLKAEASYERAHIYRQRGDRANFIISMLAAEMWLAAARGELLPTTFPEETEIKAKLKGK